MTYNPNKDTELSSPPTDSISSLAFNPKGNFLAAGSWDNQVRCWAEETQSSRVTNWTPKISYSHEAPVLCVSWSSDGTKLFSGSCDGKGKMFSAGNPQPVQIAQHSAGIKSCFWVDELNCLVTGSWDKTLKYWDLRSPSPSHTQNLPDRVYCMDVNSPLCVVATADKNILVFDMRKPTIEFKRIPTPLRTQSRAIACFKDKTGFALGSIEGRVAFHYIDDKDASKNYAFKCHREGNQIAAINAISVHPVFGTFSTGGSDGTFHFWDKENRVRLKAFTKMPAPISATCFSPDGNLFAYAVSYDWYKGIEGYYPNGKNYIFLHTTNSDEMKTRRRQ